MEWTCVIPGKPRSSVRQITNIMGAPEYLVRCHMDALRNSGRVLQNKHDRPMSQRRDSGD